ncbi:MAG: hypothetical protein GOV01_04070 [Candidatus Altiarchaeota archaeon]|nr:hypothetical protein [Candidatus Altiarchaeota archaeon]
MTEYKPTENVHLVDFDDTITDPLDSGNCWFVQSLENIATSETSSRFLKFKSKIIGSVLDSKRSKNQDTDPKPYHIRLLSWLANGARHSDLFVDRQTMIPNMPVIDWIESIRANGDEIHIASMSPTLYIQEWLRGNPENEMTDIEVDGIYGLAIDLEGYGSDALFRGIDRTDVYTDLAASVGAKFAKAYCAAELINKGYRVVSAIGNSVTDLISKEDVFNHLKERFGWSETQLSGLSEYLVENPIYNLHLPANGEENKLYKNGDLSTPILDEEVPEFLETLYHRLDVQKVEGVLASGEYALS